MQDMGPEEKRVLGARDAQRLPATKCVLASKLLAQSGSGDVVREARKDWIHRVCMLGRCLLKVLCFSQSSAEFEVTLSGEAFPLRLHAGGCCVFACDVLVSHPVSCTFELETETASVHALGLCRRLGLGALSSSSSALCTLGGSFSLGVISGQRSCPVSRLFLKVLTLRLLWLNLAPIETSGSQAKARAAQILLRRQIAGELISIRSCYTETYCR